MPRAMYSYTIKVLQSVSFDTDLFCREAKKAIAYLLPHEREELKLWMRKMVFLNPHLDSCMVYFN
jgi:hypothetical protein